MPFVNVWVDEDPCEGDCDRAEKLASAVDDAISLLDDGDISGAMSALRSTKRTRAASVEDHRLRVKEKLYSEWRQQPLPRPDFLSFERAASARSH